MESQAIISRLGVSRETMERLEAYVALVETWQSRVSLVSRSSLPHIWMRHVWDSAQLAEHLPAGRVRVLDVGSGAGFPGIVLAMTGDVSVDLVESDGRKAAFLNHVIEALALDGRVHNERIEALPRLGTDVITARAVAPMPRLLKLLRRQFDPGTRCLLLKGESAKEELARLGISKNLSFRLHPSLTNPNSFVVDIEVS